MRLQWAKSKWSNAIIYLHSTGKNSAQTDEEKQRERQRNEREQKNAELEALHIKVNTRTCFQMIWIWRDDNLIDKTTCRYG